MRGAALRQQPHDSGRRSQCRAARARCLESQADVARRLAHTARMREARRRSERGRLDRRHAHAHAGASEALYLVELSLTRLANGGQGPQARPHLGCAGARRPAHRHARPQAFARLVASVGPRPGDGDTRSLTARRKAEHASAVASYGTRTKAWRPITSVHARPAPRAHWKSRVSPDPVAPPESRATCAPPRGSCPTSERKETGECAAPSRVRALSRWRDAGSR